MNLHYLLKQRAENNRPVGVALIGAGKFATMFLTQARLTTGMQIVGIAELEVTRGQAACLLAGWPAEQFAAQSLDDAAKTRQLLSPKTLTP